MRASLAVKVREDAPLGPLLFEARLEGSAGEALALDDRYVDRDEVTRRRSGRARMSRAATAWVCRVGAWPGRP